MVKNSFLTVGDMSALTLAIFFVKSTKTPSCYSKLYQFIFFFLKKKTKKLVDYNLFFLYRQGNITLAANYCQ